MHKREDKKEAGGTQELFESAGQAGEAASLKSGKPASSAPVRLRVPNRAQVELRAQDLESLIGEGHRARMVWGYV